MRLLRFPTLSSFKKLFRASPLLSGFNAGFVNLSISPVCHSFIMHRPLGGLSPQTGFLLHSGNLVLLRTPAVRRAAGRRPVKPIWRGKVQLSVLCFLFFLPLVSLSLTSAWTATQQRRKAGRERVGGIIFLMCLSVLQEAMQPQTLFFFGFFL